MSLIFREGVVLALAPVAAFWAALMFENGYADVFGISHELIDIDLRTMLISIFLVAAAFVPFMAFCFLLFDLGSRKEKELRWWAIQLLMILPMLICVYIGSFQSIMSYFGLGLAVIFCVIAVVRVAWKARKIGWDAALSLSADAEGIKEYGTPRAKSGDPKIWDKMLGCLMVLFILAVFGFMITGVGGVVARIKSAYPTFDLDQKKVVILSGYGDRFVLGGVKDDRFDGITLVLPKNSEKLINVKNVRYENFIVK
jgi:hypothetical protein